MAKLYTSNQLEDIRYALVQNGYWEGTIVAAGFDDSPAVLATVDGQDLGTTFPCPNGSMVVAEIEGAIYLQDINGSTDSGVAFSFGCAGFRITGGDTADVEGVNTVLEVNEKHVELNSVDGATANTITIAAAADTTNQGIDITFANDSADETGYMVGRMRLTCALEGGFKQVYKTTL